MGQRQGTAHREVRQALECSPETIHDHEKGAGGHVSQSRAWLEQKRGPWASRVSSLSCPRPRCECLNRARKTTESAETSMVLTLCVLVLSKQWNLSFLNEIVLGAQFSKTNKYDLSLMNHLCLI